jgi:CPA1 family monovalent cation:H+ antiporter
MGLSPRMRVHSYAVWATVVFLLNVIGFLVIGMQVRTIVGGMQTTSLAHALLFAGIVVVAVIGVRFVVVLAYISTTRSYERRHNRPVATLQQGVLVGWNGMRGLVTLATAFALPQSFPHRDLIVLTAFCVVITTTVLQGATLRPLIRFLRLDRSGDSARALEQARNHLLGKALEALDREIDVEAEVLKGYYRVRAEEAQTGAMARHRQIGLAVLAVQRKELAMLLQEHRIDPDAFDLLQEELDWRALDLLPPNERRIEEG